MSNAYPEKPMVPYERSTITMDIVIAYMRGRTDVPIEVKRAAYIMFRIESANGQSGFNNNFVGCQADSGRWPAQFDKVITGVVQIAENGTGRQRLFAAFDKWQSCVDFLLDRVQARGLYVGGVTHLIVHMSVGNVNDLCTAYMREWATGIATAMPSAQSLANWQSMYGQAEDHFPAAPAPAAVTPAPGREARLEQAMKQAIHIMQEALAPTPGTPPA